MVAFLTTYDQLSGQYRLVAKLFDAEDARRQQRQRLHLMPRGEYEPVEQGQ
jgi:hypothetical protein